MFYPRGRLYDTFGVSHMQFCVLRMLKVSRFSDVHFDICLGLLVIVVVCFRIVSKKYNATRSDTYSNVCKKMGDAQ